MKTSIVTRLLAAAGIALLVQSTTSFGQGISIERVQRDFQARYHLLTDGYVEWPKCNEANGTPAPHFPKDGFYGNILLNPARGVELVQDLAKKFDVDQVNGKHLYEFFVKAPDGYSSLDSAPPTGINNYTVADMPPGIAWGQVTENNYLDKLLTLASQMAQLKLVCVSASQVTGDTDVKWAQSDGEPAFFPPDDVPLSVVYQPTLSDVEACANSTYAGLAWGQFANSARHVSQCDTYPNVDLSGVAGNIQHRCEVNHEYPLALGTHGYLIQLFNQRGKIAADLSNFTKGTVRIYLKLVAPAVPTWPAPIVNSSSYGQNAPTSVTEGKYGYWSSGHLTLGSFSTSYEYVTYSDVIPVVTSTAGGTAQRVGWEVSGQVAIVQPDFTTVPDEGCCSPCSQCEPGGDPICALKSLHITIPLGSDNYGGSAGALTLNAERPSPSLATIAGLSFTKAASVVKVPSTPTTRLQFKTSQALFDIQKNTDYKYTISVYSAGNFSGTPDGSGYYPPTGSASSTTVIENPDASPSTYNKLKLTHTKDGNTAITDYTFTAGTGGQDGEWQMATGGTLRKESHNSTWNTAQTLRTETVMVRNSADQIVSKEINTYQLFPWGQELVQKDLEATASGPALTATWEFYDNSAADSGNFSHLKNQVDAYGNWTHFEYDAYGRETKRVSQFQNSAKNSADGLNRVMITDYDTSTADWQIRTIEKLMDQEIGRRYQVVHSGEVRDIVCQTPGALWTAADNLVTITKKITSGTFEDELQSIENSDGTMQLYTYNISGGVRTDTVDFGVPNGGKTAITEGTRTVTVKGSVGQLVSRKVYYIAGGVVGILLSRETYTNYDEFNRPGRVTYLDGTHFDTQYACCGVDTTTDRDGVLTQYLYDALKRQDAYVRLGITYRNILDAEGRVLVQKRIGTDASEIVLGQATYDVAGRLATEVNGLNGTTSYTEAIVSNRRVRTIAFPDTGTRVETYNQDGTLQKVTGTASFPVRYEYGIETSGTDAGRYYTKEIKLLDDQTTDSSEWTKTYTDAVARSYKVLYADSTTGTESDNPFSQSYYNKKGQLAKSVDPDGVTALYQYNTKGELEYTATDLNPGNTTVDGNGNFPIDFNADRVTRTVSDVINNALGYDVRRSQTYVYPTDSSSTAVLVAKNEVSTDGLRLWQTTYNYTPTSGSVVTSSQTAYNDNDGTSAAGYRTTTVLNPDNTKTVSVSYQGRLLATTQKKTDGGQLTKTTYTYDTHGRLWTTTDARNGVTTYAYNNADLANNITTPPPGNGQSVQVTTTDYNTSLRAWRVTQPDGTSTLNDYFYTGLLKKTYGSQTYPVEYTYDYAGRMKTMTTWKDFNEATGSGTSGSAATTWYYNQYRGWLEKKVYAGETDNTVDYEYKPSGRLWKHNWERGVTTTYGYNSAGDLGTVAYSDATPGVTYTYDRRGRQKTITQGSAVTTLTYNDVSEVLTEAYSGGGTTLNGLTVTRHYDSYFRRDTLGLNSPTAISHTYGYDSTSGRLQTVADGTYSATYGYMVNSPLANTVTFKQSTTPRLTTTKSYDFLNRLSSVVSAPSGSGVAPLSSTYTYNSANQRTRNATADGSYWNYEYDSMGQVKRGAKYFTDGYPMPGQQFEYSYDDIGNRTGTKAGGDENGANLRTATYTPNSVNQYTSRTVPGGFDVSGLVLGNIATVTVNGSAPWRKGEYFRREVTVANNSAAAWPLVTVSATGETAVNGYVFVPQTPESFTPDADGNLTGDGRWTYEWDAENRLKVMRSLSGSPAPERRLVFEYDSMGRRIRKTVWNDRDDGQGSEISDTVYVYDGWNLIAELDANNANAVINSYLWGADLSGSLQGAGGVGGLLAVKDTTAAHFVAYDGNGNVVGLVKATDGTVSANYEYGPFGEPVRANGTMATANPFRFSTKYQDNESDLLYYGYRYYNVAAARWLNRDTIEESGGANLYAFASNDGLNMFDYLGREPGVTTFGFANGQTKIIVGHQGVGVNTPDPVGVFTYRDKTVVMVPGAKPPEPEPETATQKIITLIVPNPLETVRQADESFATAANPDLPKYLRVSAVLAGTSVIILGVVEFVPGAGIETKPIKQACGQMTKKELEEEILRILKARERQLVLGEDPVKGFIQHEGTAGFRLEQAYGRQFERGSHVGIDLVDKAGDLGNISLKGPMPVQGNLDRFANSVVRDTGRNVATETVVVDTLGLSDKQIERLKNLIETRTQGTSKRIIYLESKKP